MARSFLIVAGDGKVREALAGDLRAHGYKVTLAASGKEAERVAGSVAVDAALVESHLPDTTGEELRAVLLRARPECRVTVLTGFRLVRNTPEMLRLGNDDWVLRSAQLFELLRAHDVDDTPDIGTVRAENALLHVVDVLVGLLEIEHKLFASSSHQAMQLARATAEELGGDAQLLHEVTLGTLLRDVGRVAQDVGDGNDEAEETGDEPSSGAPGHVSTSVRLFEHIDFPWKVLPVVRHHHEHYDGTGGPDGLRGREIPMGARIVSVVDSYVSMTACSEDALPPGPAMDALVQQAGHRFDPEVVEGFQRVIDKRLEGRQAGKGKPTILLVEQNREFRRLLKMRLANEGLKVVEVKDYDRALERLLKNPPDLALVDIDADTGEAFQLLNEMQIEPLLCSLPIAFMSHKRDRLVRLRALRQGVDDFLVKGDDLEELVARVQNILLREAIRSEQKPRRRQRGITGDLENLSLPDIIQTLTIGMKTACVTLSSADSTGQIWLEHGTPTHAHTGDLEGEDAFYAMVRWGKGEFVIEHGVRADRKTLEHDAMYLLMEGLRLLDESSELAPAAS